MPDVLLFGATGYTGRLTATALARRNIPFIACGRDRARLEAVAMDSGAAEVRLASVGDVDALIRALDGVKVMISCVGPFLALGATAIEAALRAKVHYTDSSGEGAFIAKLLERDGEFVEAGIAVAPAMGFDEVPADVAATLATEEMSSPSLDLTYALPRHASTGTLTTSIQFFRHQAPFIEQGRVVEVAVGARSRWAPMPPPLGPRRALSFPLAEGYLAPLHIELRNLGTYVTAGRAERLALKVMATPIGEIMKAPGVGTLIERVAGRGEGPDEHQRAASRWTILAEAREGGAWRNVTLMGTDVYGITAETLTTAADVMREPGYDRSGVLSPVQAVGLDALQKTLIDQEVTIEIHEPHADALGRTPEQEGIWQAKQI